MFALNIIDFMLKILNSMVSWKNSNFSNYSMGKMAGLGEKSYVDSCRHHCTFLCMACVFKGTLIVFLTF